MTVKKVGCPCSLVNYTHFSTDRAQLSRQICLVFSMRVHESALDNAIKCAERMRNANVKNDLNLLYPYKNFPLLIYFSTTDYLTKGSKKGSSPANLKFLQHKFLSYSDSYCSVTTIIDKSVDTFEENKRFLSASFGKFFHVYIINK